ncbi:hypothetical protein ACRCPS_18250 [Pseudomonas aeruginosa]
MTVDPLQITVTTTHSVRRSLTEACGRLLGSVLAADARECVLAVYERLKAIDEALDASQAFTLTLDVFSDPQIQTRMQVVWDALDQLDKEPIASSRKATFIYWSYLVGVQRIDRDILLRREVELMDQVLGEEGADLESLKLVCHWAGVEYEEGTYATADDLKISLLKAGIPVYEIYAALPNIFPPFKQLANA